MTAGDKRFFYNGMGVVQERDAANVIKVKYVRSGNIGGLLSRTIPAAGSTPEKHYFYHYDGSGNVTALTNETQQVVARYGYDAYGNTINAGLVTGDAALTDATDQAQQNGNLYRYSTKELHTQSGFYYYGFRFYSPGLGRWINRDPLGETGGLNLYVAFSNNPVNKADSYGLIPFHLGLGLVGAGAGFATELTGQILSNVLEGQPWWCLSKKDWTAIGVATAFGGISGVSLGQANPLVVGGILNAVEANVTSLLNEGTLAGVEGSLIAGAGGVAGAAVGSGFKKFGEAATAKGQVITSYGREPFVTPGDPFGENLITGMGLGPAGVFDNIIPNLNPGDKYNNACGECK